jgi:hypothetical protein
MRGSLKKIIFSFVILLILVSSRGVAQKSDSNYVAPFIRNSKYLRYLFIADSNNNASLFSIGCQYLYVPQSNTFTTGGAHWNVGLNIARFFTKKIILGVCYDLKEFDGFTQQHFSKSFVNDFNANFIPSYSNGMDSLRAYTLKNVVNGYSGYGINGNTFENIGISFSPFPQKYGGILIQIKRGNRVMPVWGPKTDKLSVTEDDYAFLTLGHCYSVDVCFTPYKFFTTKRIKLFDQRVKDFYKFFVVSLYYERLTLQYADFNGVALNKIVSDQFVSKYSNDNHFGIKVGVALY